MINKELERLNSDIIKIINKNYDVIILVGARGTTKTYSVKKHILNESLNGFAFTWYFRTFEDIKSKAAQFLDSLPDEYKEIYATDTKGIYFLTSKKDVKKYAGLFIPLSKYNRFKSGELKNNKYNILDEFIPEDGIYAKNELYALNNLIESMGRWTENQKLILMANSVKSENLYFNALKIDTDDIINNIYNRKEAGKASIFLKIIEANSAFIEEKQDTLAHKLGESFNLGYNDYALNNTWLLDNNDYIIDVENDEETELLINPIYNLMINNKTYSLFQIPTLKLYFLDSSRFYNDKETYQLKTIGYSLNQFNKPLSIGMLKRLQAIFLKGLLRFNNQTTKEDLLSFIKNGNYY